MYPGSYAQAGELTQRRYLVATLLYDAWLPRALVADLPDAERKAFYWSGIYGAARTRITEVWVRARPQAGRAESPQQPTEAIPTLEPEAPRPAKPRFAARLARLDIAIDPAYAKALADAFLLYVGSQIALRALEGIRAGIAIV
jgi:hypothetical protein